VFVFAGAVPETLVAAGVRARLRAQAGLERSWAVGRWCAGLVLCCSGWEWVRRVLEGVGMCIAYARVCIDVWV
jgi:hypothetical protein